MSDKTRKDGTLSMSATSGNLYEGSLCFSVAHYYFPKAYSCTRQRNDRLLSYGDAYQLNDRVNVGTMNVRACVFSERCESGSVFMLE